MRKFWHWAATACQVKNEAGRTLHLNGPIAEETWWGDEVTPAMFKDELDADVTFHEKKREKGKGKPR